MSDEKPMGEPSSSDEFVPFREAVLQHVEDLIRASEAVFALHLPHIAYHLATLALEEVGKLEIVEVTRNPHVGELDRDERSTPEKKFFDDHVGKIFWALWAPTFGQDVISQQQIDALQNAARSVHERRKQGLYVEVVGHGEPMAKRPRTATDDADAAKLLRIARAGLERQRAMEKRPDPVQAKEIARSLWAMTRDVEHRRFVMGADSMKMLAQLGKVREWVGWLERHFAEEAKHSAEWLRRELDRNPDAPTNDREKWRVRLRFHSGSHVIRQTALNRWNTAVEAIKLSAVPEKKGELLVEVTLPSAVLLHEVWDRSLDVSHRFLLAINVGTRGFFYWYLPQHTKTFYERVVDIDSRQVVLLARTLPLDFEGSDARDALNEDDVAHVLAVAAVLFRHASHPAFDHYLLALALVAKTDIHTRLESQAFEEFALALQGAARLFGVWDGKSPFEPVFKHIALAVIPTLPPEQISEYLDLLSNARMNAAITMEHVRALKLITDAYWVTRCHALLQREHDRQSADTVEPHE